MTRPSNEREGCTPTTYEYLALSISAKAMRRRSLRKASVSLIWVVSREPSARLVIGLRVASVRRGWRDGAVEVIGAGGYFILQHQMMYLDTICDEISLLPRTLTSNRHRICMAVLAHDWAAYNVKGCIIDLVIPVWLVFFAANNEESSFAYRCDR